MQRNYTCDGAELLRHQKEKEETESEEKKTSSKAEKKVDHRKLPTLFDYHRRKTKNQLKKIRKPWVQPLWYLELKDEKKDLEFDSVPDWMDIESLVAGTTTDGGAMISIGKLRVRTNTLPPPSTSPPKHKGSLYSLP